MLDTEHGIVKNLEVDKPEETYSLGLYEGSSPFTIKPSANAQNPIISRRDFLNENVNFVADPFGIYHLDQWYLFYESMNVGSRKGKICVSTSSDRSSWTEGAIVLDEPFHLSYPQVFKVGSDIFMVPESFEANEIRLYRANNFPYEWEFEKVLLQGRYVDSTLYFKDELWWMFACDAPEDHNSLRLYYTDNLYGDWQEHPESPICKDEAQNSRPAGKLIEYRNKLYRFAQDCSPFYGHSVRAFEIETLNLSEYKEKEMDSNPYLEAGHEKWNRVSMHHIDLHKIDENHWIAFVDGRSH